jgi:hypothetical protein
MTFNSLDSRQEPKSTAEPEENKDRAAAMQRSGGVPLGFLELGCGEDRRINPNDSGVVMKF